MTKSIIITKSGNLSLDNFFKIRKKDRYIVNLRKKVLKILETDGTLLIKNFKIENKYHENQKKFKLLSSYFGTLLKQNLKGEKIVKIEDQGKKWSSKTRGYKTNDYLDMHTDGGAVSALFCIRNSKHGGESIYADARKIYKSIKDKNLKNKLFEGFKYHTRNESKDRSLVSKSKFPVFFFNKNKLHCMYNRKPIEEALKIENKSSDLKYLKKFQKYFSNLKNYQKFKLKPGDIWIVNNFIGLHGRKNFTDTKSNKRLLMRAWINPKNFSYRGKTLLEAYNNK